VEALARALVNDPRLFVRDAAAEALGTIGGRGAMDALSQAAVRDPDAWVRETAAEAALNSLQ
jgi:HEAT repeat protein